MTASIRKSALASAPRSGRLAFACRLLPYGGSDRMVALRSLPAATLNTLVLVVFTLVFFTSVASASGSGLRTPVSQVAHGRASRDYACGLECFAHRSAGGPSHFSRSAYLNLPIAFSDALSNKSLSDPLYSAALGSSRNCCGWSECFNGPVHHWGSAGLWAAYRLAAGNNAIAESIAGFQSGSLSPRVPATAPFAGVSLNNAARRPRDPAEDILFAPADHPSIDSIVLPAPRLDFARFSNLNSANFSVASLPRLC